MRRLRLLNVVLLASAASAIPALAAANSIAVTARATIIHAPPAITLHDDVVLKTSGFDGATLSASVQSSPEALPIALIAWNSLNNYIPARDLSPPALTEAIAPTARASPMTDGLPQTNLLRGT